MDDSILANGMDTEEAAEFLCLSPKTLCTWRAKRRSDHRDGPKGPRYYRVGGKVIYLRADLERFLAACAVDPAARNAQSTSPPSRPMLEGGPVLTAEALRDNLIAVGPGTEIMVTTPDGSTFRVRSALISAGGSEPDSVKLICEEL